MATSIPTNTTIPAPTGGTQQVPTATPSTVATQGQPFTDGNGNTSLAQFSPLSGHALTPGQSVPVPVVAPTAPVTSGTPTAIAADNLTTTQTAPVVAAPVPNTTTTGLQSTVNSSNDAYKASIAADTTKENALGTKQGGLANDISTLLDQEGQISGAGKEALYSANGVDTKAAAVNAISSQIDAANKATNDQIAAIQSSGTFGASSAAQIAYLQRTNAQYTANLAINLNAAQGQYTAAQSIAERQLADQLAPIQAAIQSKQFLYTNNQNLFDKADSQRLQDQSNYLSTLKDQSSSAISNITTMMTNGTVDPAKGAQAISDVLGGKISLSDVYKNLGIGTNNPQNPGNIAGFDISSYATDPQHEIKVASIYNNLPAITDAASAQAAIDATGIKNSPVTGQMIMDAATTNNVDPKLIFALIQNDSSLGTAGKAVKTNNPGNVGNDDAGNTQTFKTIAQGVNAVGSWLASHRSSQPTYQQYGLLANTSFNPSNTVDAAANNYLTQYLKNGTLPTPTQLGISSRSGSGVAMFSKVATRASDLYYAATGQSLPDPAIQKANIGLIAANNKLLNGISVQSSTVGKNFALAVSNLTANNLNQNSQPINNFLDSIKNALGDPAVAQYMAQNATLGNEVGSLLAVKNASGTTVHDKLESAGLINNKMSADQEVAVIKTILTEAQNAQAAIQGQNSTLYQQVDPLQQDSNNPNKTSATGSGTSTPTVVDPTQIPSGYYQASDGLLYKK